MDLQTGDRLQHHTGTIYPVHEKYPSGNCMIGIGSADRVLATKGQLEAQTLEREPMGEIPYGVMGYSASPHWRRL